MRLVLEVHETIYKGEGEQVSYVLRWELQETILTPKQDSSIPNQTYTNPKPFL